MRQYIFLITIIIMLSCSKDNETIIHPFPTETYFPFNINFTETFENDTIAFYLENPVKCYLRIALGENTINPGLNDLFEEVTLKEFQDTIIKVEYPNFNDTDGISYSIRYGDLNKVIEKNEIDFPFPRNKTYEVIQGNCGSFSHADVYSKSAIDFSLQIGDTITSADDGYVVGIIEGYSGFGTTEEWAQSDKSNYITMYHPESGLFTQYVHLDQNGSLVELNDFIKKGQAIGISGMTGFTNIPHLHFGVKVPTENDFMHSTSITFEGGVAGKDLKKGDRVR